MSVWAKFNQREKVLIILIVTIILPAAFYFYFYQPLEQKIEVKRNQLQEIKADFEIEKNLAADKSKLEQEYNKIKEQLTSNNQLVTKNELLELIVSLNQLAEKNDLSLLIFKPQESKNVKSYTKRPINLQLGGSYQNMLAYLEDIYHLNYLLRVEKIAFSATNKSATNNSELTMGIKIVGYNLADSSKGD